MELRPLTLLYGPNNVGKSALLRILPLIGDSLAPDAAVPLVLSGAAGRGAAFSDILWSGERESDEVSVLTIGLDFPPESGVHRIELEIHALDAGRHISGTPIVRAFSVWNKIDERGWRAQRLVADGEDPAAELPFEVHSGTSRTRSIKVRFEGLVPFSNARLPGLVEAREALKALRGNIQWLTAPRTCEQRLIPEPVGASPGLLSPRSEVAALQALRADPTLAEQVSLWYRAGGGEAATQGAAREIRFEPVPPSHFRALMATPGTSRLAVNIADAGAGWVQLLPVLTALALAERDRGPHIVAIEEPESNLHPSAQRAIAQAVTDVVHRRRDACLVLETHSYPLLQYLQLQILAGKLSVGDVVVHWVSQSPAGESQLVRGTFDKAGSISSNWPSSAFIESLDLAREIAAARRKTSR
jgi:AAA domain, putative AbiEii toxin, Type IV TA system